MPLSGFIDVSFGFNKLLILSRQLSKSHRKCSVVKAEKHFFHFFPKFVASNFLTCFACAAVYRMSTANVWISLPVFFCVLPTPVCLCASWQRGSVLCVWCEGSSVGLWDQKCCIVAWPIGLTCTEASAGFRSEAMAITSLVLMTAWKEAGCFALAVCAMMDTKGRKARDSNGSPSR